MLNIKNIEKTISEIPFVNKVYFIEQKGIIIQGKLEILFPELSKALDFNFSIYPQYPFKQSYDSESITFFNKDLIPYNHVMGDGSICIHTSHHNNISKKLQIDFNSLKAWIVKYYINKEQDANYEHIIVPESTIDNKYFSYIFTGVNHTFKKEDFGEVHISLLSTNIFKQKEIINYIVKAFTIPNKKIVSSEWSSRYNNKATTNIGLYIFIEDQPAIQNRFAFYNWLEFEKYFPEKFLNYLYSLEELGIKKDVGKIIPLFIGYKTVNDEIHWQVAILEIGNFPLKGVPEIIRGKKTGKWNTKLTDQKIKWAITRNSSYKYFFGRGILNKKITDSKILIIGIGAIGSILSKTLVRGGCKYIDISDYDIKEPENVCRSEYFFSAGLTDKTFELSSILSEISPFVEVNIAGSEYFRDIIKIFWNKQNAKKVFSDVLNQYDIIFDCTTDNDLMYILNLLELKNDLINLSITNHANDLVCAFHPSIYNFVNSQFKKILTNDLSDLYNPTGCWSPTFKASYTDIDLLVQTAIKHINNLYETGKQKNNFIIKPDIKNNLNLKIVEY